MSPHGGSGRVLRYHRNLPLPKNRCRTGEPLEGRDRLQGSEVGDVCIVGLGRWCNSQQHTGGDHGGTLRRGPPRHFMAKVRSMFVVFGVVMQRRMFVVVALLMHALVQRIPGRLQCQAELPIGIRLRARCDRIDVGDGALDLF